jgi:uncharacterized membrane protein
MMPTEDVMANHPDQKLHRMVKGYDKRVVRHLNNEFDNGATTGDRFADSVASRVGSWAFIIVQSLVLAAWILWNVIGPESLRFDKAPFIAMNLLLSFQAAYTAPFIMMSANRTSKREHLEAEISYAINFRAEQEVANLQSAMHSITEHMEAMTTENKALHGKLDQLLKRLDQQ